MFELENEFNIKIPEKITITTIQDLVDLIAKLISEQYET
jgi:acyl carrier protein